LPNHYGKPAESSEPVEQHTRLTQEQVDVVANEFHSSRIPRNPRASPFTSARRIEMFLSCLASGRYYNIKCCNIKWGFPSVNTGAYTDQC
jgi:hypothetical protein